MASLPPDIMIRSDRLSAAVAPLGAELRALRDAAGRDLLWDGDPAWWSGRAPLLFPVVGRVAYDRLRLRGESWPMPKHGFARRSLFRPVAQEEDAVTLRLADSAETRAAYPFAFALDVTHRIDRACLTATVEVRNADSGPMPFRIGFHPAFRWPLPDGGDRAAHRLRFDRPEPAPIRRVDATGLLTPEEHASPVEHRDLALADALFVDDALIFPAPASRGCTYGAPGRPGLRLAWPDLPSLGIWTRPGAPYLCIEPWQGFADRSGETGDFAGGHGVVTLDPGATRRFTMTVELIPAA